MNPLPGWFKIVVGAVLIAIYLNIGAVIGSAIGYGNYYPRSVANKILWPVPPVDFLDSPFDKGTPEINKRLESKYGSFETYRHSINALIVKVTAMIIWPVMFGFYLVAAISWVGFLGWKLVLLLWWLFKGIYFGGFLERMIFPRS